MKYLLLLLITFNVYAEIKVTVKKVGDGSLISDPKPFSNQIEADAWIADNEKMLKNKKHPHRNSFGLVDRWLKYDNGNSVDSREVVIPPVLDVEGNVIHAGHSYFEYKYLQNYVVSSEDITVAMDLERAEKLEDINDRAALRDFDLDKLKKKSTESVAEYRDRRDLILIRMFKRLFKDKYGKKQE